MHQSLVFQDEWMCEPQAVKFIHVLLKTKRQPPVQYGLAWEFHNPPPRNAFLASAPMRFPPFSIFQ